MKEAFRKRDMDKMGGRIGADSMVAEDIGTSDKGLAGNSNGDMRVFQSLLAQLKLFPKLLRGSSEKNM